jgi:hypothetical protein
VNTPEALWLGIDERLGEESMSRTRRVMAMLFAFAVLGASAAPVASAAITESNNNGHPNTNPAENCPTGQNKGATPGALKKC